jgi:hypothetical protein
MLQKIFFWDGYIWQLGIGQRQRGGYFRVHSSFSWTKYRTEICIEKFCFFSWRLRYMVIKNYNRISAERKLSIIALWYFQNILGFSMNDASIFARYILCLALIAYLICWHKVRNIQRTSRRPLKKTNTVLVSFSKNKLKPFGEVVLKVKYKDHT